MVSGVVIAIVFIVVIVAAAYYTVKYVKNGLPSIPLSYMLQLITQLTIGDSATFATLNIKRITSGQWQISGGSAPTVVANTIDEVQTAIVQYHQTTSDVFFTIYGNVYKITFN